MENIFESIEREYSEIKENYTSMSEELNEYRKKNAIVGYVYILVNPLFDLVKIGYAKDVEKRIKELSGSGMPDPYHCYAAYGVTEARTDLEIHNLIDSLDPDLRHNANREFYEITKERAYKILESIAKISGTSDRLVINPLNDDYFSTTKKVKVEPSSEEKTISESKTSYKYICIPEGFYHNKNKSVYAYVSKNGEWTIRKGSFANTKTYERSGVHSRLQDDRWNHIENNAFKEDVNLGSVKPSGAANYIENRAMNGWDYWYTEDNIVINDAFHRNTK